MLENRTEEQVCVITAPTTFRIKRVVNATAEVGLTADIGPFHISAASVKYDTIDEYQYDPEIQKLTLSTKTPGSVFIPPRPAVFLTMFIHRRDGNADKLYNIVHRVIPGDLVAAFIVRMFRSFIQSSRAHLSTRVWVPLPMKTKLSSTALDASDPSLAPSVVALPDPSPRSLRSPITS